MKLWILWRIAAPLIWAFMLFGCQANDGRSSVLPSFSNEQQHGISLRPNGVLLPYDIKDSGAKWRHGFLLNSHTVIGPVAAAEEGTFIVATVNRKGGWESEIIDTRNRNNCTFVAKLTPPVDDAVTLEVGDPKNFLDQYVVFKSFNGTRIIFRGGVIQGFFEYPEGGKTYIKISAESQPGDAGGFILAPNGDVIGVVCDNPFTPSDGWSIVGLSLLDLIVSW